MNTKQVLYNALKSQLDIKEQEYKLFYETITTPAIEEVNNEIKQFFNTLTPINDASFDIGSSRITIHANENGHFVNGWYRNIEFVLQSSYKNDNKHVDINWNSGTFNLGDKFPNKIFINLISVCANNLKTIENEWVNNWYEKRKQIDKNDDAKNREFTDLQSALNNLRNEIIDDAKETMKQIGFEIKKFKDVYDLDWDYNKDNTKRIYKINKTAKAIRLQIGRSHYDTTYVNGFKVLGKKGNKYKIEVYRESSDQVYNYEVLEKKFDSFVSDVSEWETKHADKRKNETEQSYKQRTQQQAC